MKKLSTLSDLKNIGSKSEQWLNDFDIYTKEDIEEYGPVLIYKILRDNGYPVSKILVYALQGAIMNIHWNELPPEIKKEIDRELSE